MPAQRRSSRPRVRVLAAAAAGLAIIAGMFLGAMPASAHDELVSSNPASGAQIDALPTEIVLTFSESLLAEQGATAVAVTDAAGRDLTGGDPVLDGAQVTQPLAPGDEASGVITVIWRVASSDGHPISDEFTFTVGGGAQAPTPTPGASTPAVTAVPVAAPATADTTWIWITLGVVLVGLGGALVAVLVAKARGSREH